MRTLRALMALALLGSLVATQPGCLVVAAGAAAAGTVAYVRGDLEATLDAPAARAGNAARKVVQDMKLAMVSGNVTDLDAKVIARTADDTKIEITVTGLSEKSSKISIRVGIFGDKDMSMRILDRVKASL